jgi:hypothetical protein
VSMNFFPLYKCGVFQHLYFWQWLIFLLYVSLVTYVLACREFISIFSGLFFLLSWFHEKTWFCETIPFRDYQA